MQKEVGSKKFPIWLLGDSNPSQWQDKLLTPLDPRHPVRHTILTSVLDVIQDKVFREQRIRVDMSTIYIRNAIEDSNHKPAGNVQNWSAVVGQEVEELRQSLDQNNPIMLFCFGAFSFEFARRALNEEPQKYNKWGAKLLGDAFRQRIDHFDPKKVNLLPLLHVSIARGKFIESHNYFTHQENGNYFDFVGNTIADKLLQHRDHIAVWIESAKSAL